MTPQEQIDKLVEEAYAKITEAEKIADENDIGFSFSLAYGMGGYYRPQLPGAEEKLDDWGESETGWRSSTASCS